MTQVILETMNWLHLSSIVDFFNDLARQRRRRALVRDTMAELSSLSDAELYDIGISRSDIRAVAEDTFSNV